MSILRFPGMEVKCSAPAGSSGEAPFHTLDVREVALTVPRDPVDFYRHGWQSWSLTCWHGVNAEVPLQRPAILRPMQIDPLNARRRDAVGSWVGAVRFGDGAVLLLGALGTDARVEYVEGTLRGISDRSDARRGRLQWLVAFGSEEDVFASYAEALGDRFGTAPGRPAPRIWCSWYSLYAAITETVISAILPQLKDLPVDVVQIDDGWQVSVGDWSANLDFPSGMPALAAAIRDTGKTAGLWLAPLIVAASSHLASEHRDWILHDNHGRPVSAGFNWGEQLYALDTTHPAALAWVCTTIQRVREWGYDYLKLDFLYAGALPGVRHTDILREAAYREALRSIREAAGDAYLVACGAPIVPSLGLCDAIRVGPDVADFWTSNRDEHLLCNPTIPGTRNAIRTTVHRLWLKSIVRVDPDAFYVANQWNTLTTEQKAMQRAAAQVCGFLATSDLPSWVTDCETVTSSAATLPDRTTESTIATAFASSTVSRRGPYSFEIDGSAVGFESVLGLPGPRNALERIGGAILGWLGNRKAVVRLTDQGGRREAARRVKSIGPYRVE